MVPFFLNPFSFSEDRQQCKSSQVDQIFKLSNLLLQIRHSHLGALLLKRILLSLTITAIILFVLLAQTSKASLLF